MGITRKCDRCGKYYLRNIKHEVQGKPSVTMEGITFVDVTANITEWFCLCDDCITELKDFMAMEEMKMETNFEISMELRPCIVYGEEALFHSWITDDRILLKEERHLTQEDKEKAVKYYIKNSIVPIGYETVKTSKTYGLVEMHDGQIKYIEPTDIQFVDRKIDEYTFKY